MQHTRRTKPCHLCGLVGTFEALDVSGDSCGSKPCTPCSQLKQLDSKIKETANLLQRLLVLRHDLKSKRNHHHDQLLNRLPLELLSRIFSFCHPCLPIRGSKAFAAFQRLHIEPSGITPWRLALVCKSWRDVVWSTPQLWTSVSLNTANGWKKGYLEFAREWLLRSGGLPLSLTLYEGDDHLYTPEKATVDKSLFEAINKSSPRWRVLNISASDRQLNYLSRDLGRNWILQDLHVEQLGSPDSTTAKARIFNAHGKPTPRRISIYNVDFSNMDITWDHLTHVDVTFTIADCFKIFRHAHRMTHFTFHPINRRGPPPAPLPQPIVHNSLQVFENLSSSSLTSLLDSLTLPSLQELCIIGDLSNAMSLVKRSGCRITRLNVSVDWFGAMLHPERRFIALLEQLPFLTDLTLSRVPISNTFFERLGPIINTSSQSPDAGNGTEEFLPVLRSLKTISPLWFQWECVADMFVSIPGMLKHPRRALQSFEMRIVEEEDEDDWTSNEEEYLSVVFPRICDPLPEDVVLRLLAVREGGVRMWIIDDYERDLLCISSKSES